MRVTNSMLVSNFMNNLNNNMIRLDDLQNQMATNKKFAHISDDPIGVIYSQEARHKLARLENYQNTVGTARSWVRQAESGLTDINTILTDAYEGCIDAATDLKSGGDKLNASKYLQQLRDQLLQTLNMSYGDKFVFGGYNTTGYSDGNKMVGPFGVDPVSGGLTFNGVDLTDPANMATIDGMQGDVLTFDVGPGIEMPVTLNGISLAVYKTKVPYTVSKPVQKTDINGIPMFDGSGDPIYVQKTDEDGNLMYAQGDPIYVQETDGSGNPLTDIDGKPVYKLLTDSDGNPVYDADNNPMYEQAVDSEGNPMFAQGDPIYETEEVVEYRDEYVNIYNLLDDLFTAVESGESAGDLDRFLPELQKAQRHILSFMAEIGGRDNRLEMLESRYETDEINYYQMKSDAEDADASEVIMRFKMAQSVYQAALSSGSYIIQQTLMDFLR